MEKVRRIGRAGRAGHAKRPGCSRRGFIAATSAVMLGFYLSGCSATEAEAPYHYDLSDELRLTFSNADAVIQEIREALERHDYRIHISFNSADGYMEDVEPLVTELIQYALADTESPTQGDYIRYQYGGYTLGYSHEKQGTSWHYTITITPVYYTKLAQEAQVDADIAEILDGFSFDGKSSEYEKVKAVYDFVCTHVSFDSIHKSSLYHLKSTAYAALEKKSAACQGYSVLIYRLLKELGVGVRVLTGIGEYEGKAEYHAWNIVRIDGLYYNVDATWDARLGADTYFLKGNDTFTDHTRSDEFLSEDFLEAYPMSAEDFC